MSWLAKKLMGFFEIDRFDYKRVALKRDVLDEIIALARENAPKEFMALLEGKVDKKTRTLAVTGLYYQIFYSSKQSAFMLMNLPMGSNVFGSVHSHPGEGKFPSRADMRFFNKHGTFHLIIASPYTRDSIAAYDSYGREMEFEILK